MQVFYVRLGNAQSLQYFQVRLQCAPIVLGNPPRAVNVMDIKVQHGRQSGLNSVLRNAAMSGDL